MRRKKNCLSLEGWLLHTSNFFFRFVGGELNICYNAVDRHVENGRGDQVAIIYDSPVTNTKEKITYKELLEQVCFRITLLMKRGSKYFTIGRYQRVEVIYLTSLLLLLSLVLIYKLTYLCQIILHPIGFEIPLFLLFLLQCNGFFCPGWLNF